MCIRDSGYIAAIALSNAVLLVQNLYCLRRIQRRGAAAGSGQTFMRF